MSRQGESPKVRRTRFQAQSADPVNPQEGDVFRSDGTVRTEGLWEYRQSAWQFLAPQTEGLIQGDNATFDGSVGDWAAYADAADSVPVDGTGGSPTVTVTRTTSSPLKGSGSFLLTKDATSRQGEGASLQDLAVDPQYRGQPVKFSFSYEASAAFEFGSAADPVSSPSDISVFFYDVTNSQLLAPTSPGVFGGGYWDGTIQVPSTCASLRPILHIATTTSPAWTFKADSFKLDLSPNDFVRNASDWINDGPLQIDATTTAPTKGTTEVDAIRYKINGPNADVEINFRQTAAGTAGSGTYLYTLPGNLRFDSSVPTSTTDFDDEPVPYFGPIQISNGQGNVTGTAWIKPYDATRFSIMFGPAVTDSGSGSTSTQNQQASGFFQFSQTELNIRGTFSFPAQGLTSGVSHPASIGLNAKQSLTAYKNGGSSTANVTIPSWSGKEDSLNEFDLTTGVLTIKKPGDRYISFFCDSTSAGAFSAYIYVDRGSGATIEARGVVGDGASGASGVAKLIPNLKYGDEITFRTNSSETFTADDTSNYISVFDVNSSQQPYAPRVAYVKEQFTSGTAGGTFTSGSYIDRQLNTFEGDLSFITDNGDDSFTLQPGTYDIDWSALAIQVDSHKTRLRNTTDSTNDIIGKSAENSSANGHGSASNGRGRITISEAKTYRLQHRCDTTRATYGLGSPSSYGEDEIYVDMKITKVL